MNNTGNSFEIFAEKLKGLQPVKSNEIPNTNYDPNMINKDNIFQQPHLLGKLNPTQISKEEPTFKSQSDKTSQNVANSFLAKPQENSNIPDTNIINKDNIFHQPNLLEKLYSTQISKEEPKAKSQSDKTFNSQETQSLNSYLNSLGFKFGEENAFPYNNPSSNKLEPLQLVARAKEGIYLVNDQEKDYLDEKSNKIFEDCTVSVFNRDGSLLSFASPNVVGVYILAEKKTMTINLPNVVALSFSPGQRYLTAIEKRDTKYFLSIMEADPLRKLYEFETVRYKKETWPQLKFTENDELAFWASKPTQIEVFNPRDNFRIIKTINTKSFDFFDISVKIENLLIVCVSLEKSAGYYGHEGRIDIYKYSDLTLSESPMVSKIIDKAHEVNLFFSPTGQNLLIWAQTFTDRTGQSYYGEHMLLYLDTNQKALKRVPTYKGPIHDVAWNPNGMEFIAISGFMPAGSVLYDSMSVPKFEFGVHHKNTIKWSPLSRFVCLGGFGNLPGDMEMWDVYSLKQVGTCKSGSAVTCRWAPDGRRILTGVLNPRLRVSNNYKIFKYNGELLHHVDFSKTELYEVLWKPGKFVDRPASPTKPHKKSVDIEKSESDKGESNSDKPEEEKKIFRPKGGGSFAAQLKAERTKKSEGRHLQPDENFGNEANLEDGENKKTEEEVKEPVKKEEDQQIRKTKIMRRNEKKPDEENKESEDKANGLDQKKEPQ